MNESPNEMHMTNELLRRVVAIMIERGGIGDEDRYSSEEITDTTWSQENPFKSKVATTLAEMVALADRAATIRQTTQGADEGDAVVYFEFAAQRMNFNPAIGRFASIGVADKSAKQLESDANIMYAELQRRGATFAQIQRRFN